MMKTTGGDVREYMLGILIADTVSDLKSPKRILPKSLFVWTPSVLMYLTVKPKS